MRKVFGLIFIFLMSTSALTEELNTPEFASHLYKAIATETPDSFVFSPVATETLLACLAEGARGETKKQLMSALPPFRSLAAQREAFRTVLQQLNYLSNNLILTDTTTMILRDDIKLNKEYKEIASSSYGVKMDFVDFKNKEALYQHISRYSESAFSRPTLDRIGDHSNIFLINSLSLNATFAEMFYHHTTGVPKFRRLRRSGIFKYFDSIELNAKFLEIPFKFPNIHRDHSPLRMVIVLPNQFGGLTQLEQHGDLVFRQQPYQKVRIRVTLPYIFTESILDFKKILEHLGVIDIFNEKEADLSGMSFYNQSRYFVSQFKQAVKLNIDRQHVSAKSEGKLELSTRSQRILSFNVNRPFLYYIHLEGLILFAGRVIIMENN